MLNEGSVIADRGPATHRDDGDRNSNCKVDQRHGGSGSLVARRRRAARSAGQRSPDQAGQSPTYLHSSVTRL